MSTAQSLFVSPFLSNIILPFLLVFVVVFAILEKTKILGEEKRNANLIVAAIVGFLFIGAQSLVGFTIRWLPLVAIFLVILLGYFLVFGFVGIHEVKGLKIALGIIFGLALIISILWATGLLGKVAGAFTAETIGIIIFIAILGGTIAVVLASPTKTS